MVRVGREYTKESMYARNRYMVDHANILLAVYNGKRRSGTGMTVNYAEQKQRRIIKINPLTREVSSLNGELRV